MDCWQSHYRCAMTFCDQLIRTYRQGHPLTESAKAHREARERWHQWLLSLDEHGTYNQVEDTMRELVQVLAEYNYYGKSPSEPDAQVIAALNTANVTELLQVARAAATLLDQARDAGLHVSEEEFRQLSQAVNRVRHLLRD
jgi:predicted ArsR family transcriptional regulator